MCETQCHKDGFKYDDIASVMVEDDGEPLTKHLCKCVDNLMQDEKKEPGVALWKTMASRTHATSPQTLEQCEAGGNDKLQAMGNLVAEKRSRMKSHAKNLLEEAAVAWSLGSTWINESPHKEELVAGKPGFAGAWQNSAEPDQGGPSGRGRSC